MDGLTIENLSISFGGIRALNDVSFKIAPGEVVGLIGPNGAGKTTLLNCISRYYEPTSGKITFNGDNLLSKRPHHLTDIGLSRTFQDIEVNSSLSVIDSILLGMHSQIKTNFVRALFDFRYLKNQERKFKREARNIMRLFRDLRAGLERPQEEMNYPDLEGQGGYPDLLDVQDVPIGMLPYGIRKKTDLARALVSVPKLLLLDEPAGGLTESDIDEIKAIIRETRERFKTSILLIEHKMPLVMSLCDRVVVLEFGKKIAEGTPEEIRNNPVVIEAYLGGASVSEPGKERKRLSLVNTEESNEITQNPILEVKEVDVTYGPVQALSRVSMKVFDKCITTVLGSNGAGKSTLMRAISGIERLSSGEIWFEGQRLTHWLHETQSDKIVRKGIVHVPEGRRIFKEMSVMENLRLAGYTCKSKSQLNANIEKVFHYFPVLKDNLNLKESGNLSGGQQQMLAIGQALIMEPRVLLLDEPSLGLSPNLVEEVFEIIQNICIKESCAIVLVEQNVEMALWISSFGYVLETGYVVKSGTADQLYEQEIKKSYLGV